MKVGSLVVCVDDKDIRVAKPLVKGKIYTVRAIDYGICARTNKKVISIDLMEIYNPINEHGIEWGYNSSRFRELDTPVSISIEDILHETVPA